MKKEAADMKKAIRCMLKLMAIGFVVSAAVCAAIAYWDKIVDAFYTITDKIEEKRAKCCCDSEYDDYVEFDEWDA